MKRLQERGALEVHDIWVLLSCVKSSFHEAAEDVKRIDEHRGAVTYEEQLYWGIRALRGIRVGNVSVTRRAALAFGERHSSGVRHASTQGLTPSPCCIGIR